VHGYLSDLFIGEGAEVGVRHVVGVDDEVVADIVGVFAEGEGCGCGALTALIESPRVCSPKILT